MNRISVVLLALSLTTAGDSYARSQHQSQHGSQQADRAMGFSQSKTTHHFRLFTDGGAIEVEANDPDDVASRDRVRAHLAHIAKAFSNGDFAIPHLVHGEDPPGVDGMKRLKAAITYRHEETRKGGIVRISTEDREALDAIHRFLRYQIKEHRTGDSLEVKP